jgi:hypothetical protein
MRRNPTSKLRIAPIFIPLLLVASGCARKPDPRSLTTAELLHAIGERKKSERSEYATQLHRELDRRPRPEVADFAIRALSSKDPEHQVVAVFVLENLLRDQIRALGSELGARCEAALLRQLEDPIPYVRASAVCALSTIWFHGSSDSPPPELARALPPLLADDDVRTRGLAGLTTFFLPAPELAATLCARLGAETDPELRAFLAHALVHHGAHPGTANALANALQDSSPDVRHAAASSLADLPALDEPILLRLRPIVASALDGDLVTPLVRALAAHTRGAEAAEPLLATVFGMEAMFVERTHWLRCLGLLGGQAPHSAMATRAREVLTAELANSDDYTVEEATAALARIARASEDQELGQRMVKRSFDLLPTYDDPDPSSYSYDRTPALEALLDLVAWPEAKIDPAQLRARLTHMSRYSDRWTREWAKRRLAALR